MIKKEMIEKIYNSTLWNEEIDKDMPLDEMEDGILEYFRAAGFNFKDIDEVLEQFKNSNADIIEEMKNHNDVKESNDIPF